MSRIPTLLSIAFAASLLCTACVGNVAGPATEPKSADKEMVSDVKLEQTASTQSGTVLAKHSAH